MSRQAGIAELSSALERLARALRNRAIKWDVALSGVVVSAVDDLRILVRAIRTPGADESARVRARVEELGRLVPASASAVATPAQSQPTGALSFLASESAELARALDHLVSAADDPSARAHPAERVRALRGVAELKDIPALGEVVEAVENTLKTLELSAIQTPTTKQKTLLTASAAILRRIARDIASRGRAPEEIPELASFKAALAAAEPEAGRGDRIVPIAQLFHDDEGPHILTTAAQPPTSAAERFRLEVVSLAEHLRGVVAEARAHRGGEQRDRSSRDVRNAVRALGATANSFGEKPVARFAAEWSTRAAALEESALAAVDAAAALFTNPDTSAAEIARGLERLGSGTATGRQTPMASAAQPAPARPAAPLPPAAPAPNAPAAPAAGVARGRVRTPTGPALRALLQDGLTGLSNLDTTPLSEPAVIPDADVVPIESLLYRGRSALARAAELREQITRQGDPPSRESVQELFDLIDLALVE